MPRPKTKHVTHAGTNTIVLDQVDRDQITEALIGVGSDRDQAVRFADAANRAAVFSYELEHAMSTPGESREWYRAALKAIEQGDLKSIRTLINESSDNFDGRFGLEDQLQREPGDSHREDAIESFRAYCEKKLGYLESAKRRTPRRATCRQLLTEELVRLWRECVGDDPPYREGSNPTFLGILERIIHLSEKTYFRGQETPMVTDQVLRSLTKRARAKD